MEAEAQPNQFTNAELIERVDETLGEVIRGVGQPSLTEAIEYSVFSGGKRIRPVLCLRSCQAVGGEIESALRPAAAIELIHTFSLVHDDLPAMDDDDLRRGRPTLHKHTSEAMAILAGDAMVALAFQTLADRRPEFAHIAGEMAWWLAGMTK
ncbi:MAG: polyprenyl synthetase family protein, partial [Planctomycetota bacterium]